MAFAFLFLTLAVFVAASPKVGIRSNIEIPMKNIVITPRDVSLTGCPSVSATTPTFLEPGNQATWSFSGISGATRTCGYRFRTSANFYLSISCSAFRLVRNQRLLVRNMGDFAPVRFEYNQDGPNGEVVEHNTLVVVLVRDVLSSRTNIQCKITPVPSSLTTTPQTTTAQTTTPQTTTVQTTTATSTEATTSINVVPGCGNTPEQTDAPPAPTNAPTDAPPAPTNAPTDAPPAPTNAPPSSSCICGTLNRGTRIVGGIDANENEFPYQAGLIDRNDRGSRSRNFFCGGTLISDRIVITAAHCTEDYTVTTNGVESISLSGFYLTVVLGAHEQSNMDSAYMARATNLINHAAYNSGTLVNDIAIIEIEPLDLDNLPTGVIPICLPTDPTNLYVGESSTVTGWGTLTSGGSQPDILQEVSLPVISNDVCSRTYQITSSMICAFQLGRDSCQGDSGGPLVHLDDNDRATLIGVVSFGTGCATNPGVYTRVTSYLSWIDDNVGSLTTCPSA